MLADLVRPKMMNGCVCAIRHRRVILITTKCAKVARTSKLPPWLVKNIKITIHVNWRELEEAAQDVVKESGGA